MNAELDELHIKLKEVSLVKDSLRKRFAKVEAGKKYLHKMGTGIAKSGTSNFHTRNVIQMHGLKSYHLKHPRNDDNEEERNSNDSNGGNNKPLKGILKKPKKDVIVDKKQEEMMVQKNYVGLMHFRILQFNAPDPHGEITFHLRHEDESFSMVC